MQPDAPSDPYLEGLNDVQLEGVAHGNGPLLILAGAGSGKTRVLTRRLVYLIARGGVDPQRILAVTFTNKAAGEMRERVSRLLGPTAQAIWLGTFHSICLRILKRHQERLGFSGALTVFDTEDQLALLREAAKEIELGETLRAREAQAAISMAKNLLLDPDAYEALGGGPGRARIARLWRAYQKRLRAQDGVDFDDILLLTLELLETDPEIGDRYAERFEQILVDEYQDTNRPQFLIVRRLASAHGNVCVVGDDDQSIYRFRGADVTNILEFERHFSGARVLRMEQNYRSTTAILDVANAVIRNNRGRKEKTIWTANGPGDPVRLFLADDEEQEARQVARVVRSGLDAGERPSDFAVLYRTHAQSRPIEEAFLRQEIAYRILGGISFYQRREVKDLLAYLRTLVNPNDEVSFRRAALAPRRGAGETTLDRLVAKSRDRGVDLLEGCAMAGSWGVRGQGLGALAEMGGLLRSLRARSDLAPHLLIEEIARAVDYRGWLRAQGEGDWEERWAHVIELVEGARSYEDSEEGADLAGYLDQVALYAQTDRLTADEDRVTMMTVHNAKGLEYPNVVVSGLEEGLFPHASSLVDPEEIEEERRLFYVAVTRAQRRLTLTASRYRRRINYMGGGEISRFLREIPEGLMAADRPTVGSVVRPRRRDDEEASIERESAAARYAGLKARHVRYGIGEVVAIDGDGEQARVEVRFPGWGTKKILRSYLEILPK